MRLGVDVGGMTIKFGLYDGEALVKKWAVETPEGLQLYDVINDEIEKLGELDHVGVAVPGPIRKDGYCENCPNIPGFDDTFPAEHINVPAVICNDANVAALAEYRIGAGKGYDSIIMLTIGTGIGCGVVYGGEMLIGSHGIATEVGHSFDGPNELEKQCSARAIARMYNAETAKDVIDAARAGDQKANEVLDYSMDVLGRFMANLTLILDPEAFVIGGGVCAAGDIIMDRLRAAYDRYLITTKVRADIVVASLGNDAGIYGAAHCE